MRRREFITMLGSGLVVCPFAAQGQQRVQRLAVLAPFPASVLVAFFDELRQHGFSEGQNLAVDRRGLDLQYEQFPAAAAELVKANPDAIICAGDAAIQAAQAATTIIPIVASTDDMVGTGLV